MADKLAKGQLSEEMAQIFARTHSWEEVARVLFAKYDIHVSGQTLRRWAAFLSIPDDDANGAAKAS